MAISLGVQRPSNEASRQTLVIAAHNVTRGMVPLSAVWSYHCPIDSRSRVLVAGAPGPGEVTSVPFVSIPTVEELHEQVR